MAFFVISAQAQERATNEVTFAVAEVNFLAESRGLKLESFNYMGMRLACLVEFEAESPDEPYDCLEERTAIMERWSEEEYTLYRSDYSAFLNLIRGYYGESLHRGPGVFQIGPLRCQQLSEFCLQSWVMIPSINSWWCSAQMVVSVGIEEITTEYDLPLVPDGVFSTEVKPTALFQGEYVKVFYLENNLDEVFINFNRWGDAIGTENLFGQGITNLDNVEILHCPPNIVPLGPDQEFRDVGR